jgi:hypothetical protein
LGRGPGGAVNSCGHFDRSRLDAGWRLRGFRRLIPTLICCRERGRLDIGRGSRIRTCDLKYPNLKSMVSDCIFKAYYT